MATTVTGSLSDFYQATSVDFDVTITVNGVAPDITSDTVKFYLKEFKSGKALLDITGDVATHGADGIAGISLSKTETDLAPADYYFEIVWTLASGKRKVLESNVVTILDSITT